MNSSLNFNLSLAGSVDLSDSFNTTGYVDLSDSVNTMFLNSGTHYYNDRNGTVQQ